MRFSLKVFITLAYCSFIVSSLQAFCLKDVTDCLGTHHAWIGPEVYYMDRVKPSIGSKQDGLLYGFRGAIERDEPNALYWGVEGSYAKGTQDGHGRSQSMKVRSGVMDSEVEGRFGYTFVGDYCLNYAITPFIGVGYARTFNRYVPPTPSQLRYTDYFAFGTAGLLSQFWTDGTFAGGLNIKIRQMYEGKSRIENHPEGDLVLQVEDKQQWVFELPLSWYTVAYDRWVDVCLTPFYQYRHLGFRENSPVDFEETRLDCVGARLTVGTYF